MDRPITGFRLDAEGDWVADLSCGHGQHVRHQPPFTVREWVQTEEGRAGRLGSVLSCPKCDRAEIPEGHQPYRRTPSFDASTVPTALREDHSTKPGVWALIHVERGSLRYHRELGAPAMQTLHPGIPGVVVPEVRHRVEPCGDVSFHVEFWRQPPPSVPR